MYTRKDELAVRWGRQTNAIEKGAKKKQLSVLAPVEGLCWKRNYVANILHRFILFSLFIFSVSHPVVSISLRFFKFEPGSGKRSVGGGVSGGGAVS